MAAPVPAQAAPVAIAVGDLVVFRTSLDNKERSGWVCGTCAHGRAWKIIEPGTPTLRWRNITKATHLDIALAPAALREARQQYYQNRTTVNAKRKAVLHSFQSGDRVCWGYGVTGVVVRHLRTRMEVRASDGVMWRVAPAAARRVGTDDSDASSDERSPKHQKLADVGLAAFAPAPLPARASPATPPSPAYVPPIASLPAARLATLLFGGR